MSPRLRSIGFNSPQQQQGAIGLMAAVTLGVVLLFMLLVIDSGRLYLEQRKLQRVADMAVLEAVSRGGRCTSGTAVTYVNESATRNDFTPGAVQKITPTCGTLVTTNSLRTFQASTTQSSAIRVIATTTVPTSVAGGLWSLFSKGELGPDTTLTASAVGTFGETPLAQLTIRTTLATVDTEQSPVLDQLVGGLLGGDLRADLVSWKGLAAANINLLSYFNQLISNLSVSANLTIGSYDELLKTDIHLTQLLEAAILVLQKNGPTAEVAAKSLGEIVKIANPNQLLKLGDLLNIQSGTPNAGLDTEVTAFDLLQGLVQLSNKKSGITAHVKIDPFDIVNIDIYTKVIEPPQLSAIGNPALINGDYDGPNQISVSTAQVKTRIHIGIPVLSALEPITNLLSSVLSTVAKIVENVLNLKLVDAVMCILNCESIATLTIANELDIYIEAASANSYVKDYLCTSKNSKSLFTEGNTALAKITIGSAPVSGTFPQTDPITKNFIVSPVKLININLKKCVLLGIFPCTTGNGDGGSFNLSVETNISPATQSLEYKSPDLLSINQLPYYKSFGSNEHVLKIGAPSNSLIKTSYTPPAGKTLVGSVLSTIASLVNTISTKLVSALNTLLDKLFNPIINILLNSLGVQLAVAEVGANLSCSTQLAL